MKLKTILFPLLLCMGLMPVICSCGDDEVEEVTPSGGHANNTDDTAEDEAQRKMLLGTWRLIEPDFYEEYTFNEDGTFVYTFDDGDKDSWDGTYTYYPSKKLINLIYSDNGSKSSIILQSITTDKFVTDNGNAYVHISGPETPSEGQTYTVKGVSFKMVSVEGGTFQMGSTSGNSYEQPVHSVKLSSFSIGQTEVTQELWEAVMGSNPSYHTGNKQPVEYVSWNDCQTFITKLNQLTGKTFRLPTEAEWEYAARGGNQSNGYTYSGSNTIDDVAWYTSNSSSTTHAVATKAPNELGIYDMSGNVFEWCQDWYGSYSSGNQTNPTGPTSGSYRVCRGGCWKNYAADCRVTYRDFGTPTGTVNHLGLRLALHGEGNNVDLPIDLTGSGIAQGHEYVDLALPSGTLWATCNVGASNPEGYGKYYAWGETTTKSVYSWGTYLYADSKSKMTKYCTNSSFGIVDNRTELLSVDDAATANWGSSWRIPSEEQFVELINNNYTTIKTTTYNGKSGMLITSKLNNKSIFLPASGYSYNTGSQNSANLRGVGDYVRYWSRTLEEDRNARCITSTMTDQTYRINSAFRCCGMSVRPVLKQ